MAWLSYDGKKLKKARQSASVISKSKAETEKLRSGNRSPYSNLGLYIKKLGEQRKNSRENLSMDQRLRAKKVPDLDVDGYVYQNGLKKDDAALYRKDKNAFRNMVGNTVSENHKWLMDFNRRNK